MAHLDLDAAVDRLYGAAPDVFVGERKQLAADARAGGDRALATQILALRKPTLSAWAVNVAVRAEPPALVDFEDFAERMRAAQSSSDGAAMRALGREREPLLTRLQDAVADRAEQGGQTLTPAVLAEVRSTFVAAIADPAAAERALSGRLLRALAYAGLGEVDLTAATAGPVKARARAGQTAASAPPAEPRSGQKAASAAQPEPAPSSARGAARDPAAASASASEAGSGPVSQGPACESSAAPAPDDAHAAARRRLRTRAQDRLADAEREVTARSLAHAQAKEQADRAEARLAELERLLRRSRFEAAAAREAARRAEAALAEAHETRADAAAEVDALTDRPSPT